MLDHDDVDGQLGLELDLVEGLEIGRVRHGHREPVAALAQGQDPQRSDQLLVDDIGRQLIVVDCREIADRMAERVGREARNLRRCEAGGLRRGHQFIDEMGVGLCCLARQRLRAVRAKLSLLHERPRQTGQGAGGGGRTCSLRDGGHAIGVDSKDRIVLLAQRT
jgi:hypothetical protein